MLLRTLAALLALAIGVIATSTVASAKVRGRGQDRALDANWVLLETRAVDLNRRVLGTHGAERELVVFGTPGRESMDAG